MLPLMEHTFTMSLKGADSQRTFTGEFIYKRLNVKNRLECQKWYAQQIENIDDDSLMAVYNMLAVLRFGITKGPDWWDGSDKGLELYDMNVISYIFEEVMKFEQKWIDKIKEDSKDVEVRSLEEDNEDENA